MPPRKWNVQGAMFDVRPVAKTGQVDVSKIASIPKKINLRLPRIPERHAVAKKYIQREKWGPSFQRRAAEEPIPAREQLIQELESSLNQGFDQEILLTQAGAVLQEMQDAKPRIRPILSRQDPEERKYRRILTAIREPIREEEVLYTVAGQEAFEEGVKELEHAAQIEIPEKKAASPELASAQRDMLLDDLGQGKREHVIAPRLVVLPKKKNRGKPYKKIFVWVLFGVLFAAGAYAMTLKDRVIREGNAAIGNLQDAKTNIENLDFASAQENFLNAYQAFAQASGDINVLGDHLSGLIADLPGAGKLKSARDIVDAGKLVAEAGKGMANALQVVSRTGVVLNPNSNTRVLVSEIVGPLHAALAQANQNVQKASLLLGGVDLGVLPQDKQEAFQEFQQKLPTLQDLIQQGTDYTDFFERFVSPQGTKKYLILFENNSELRPTGGFPGTYGVLTFQDGRVTNFFADDVYNLDGQLKELIIPPKQLQHITPNWGMRDANWFIDFPQSSRKVMELFRKEAGYDVDGVIALNPNVMQKLLQIVGPIKMPSYGVTITADNFLTTVQSEVEYGEGKKINKPKQIVTDLAPIIMTKLYSADKSVWLEIFNAFMSALSEKDIVMYFRDTKMESFMLQKDFGGHVHDTQGDYLMVTVSNVKGAKTDTVTDTVVNESTSLGSNGVDHTLTITRRHNGGSSAYGFYNRQNPAYIRVLVPAGSVLTSISGNSKPSYRPLLNYPKTDFATDIDLANLEQSMHQQLGAQVGQEAGKTEFGFWMILDPGEIKTVEIHYTVPLTVADTYNLYVQKQPGLDIKTFTFELGKIAGKTIHDATISLTDQGDVYRYAEPLKRDLPIQIQLQ